jgi:hypothetical protein
MRIFKFKYSEIKRKLNELPTYSIDIINSFDCSELEISKEDNKNIIDPELWIKYNDLKELLK